MDDKTPFMTEYSERFNEMADKIEGLIQLKGLTRIGLTLVESDCIQIDKRSVENSSPHGMC